MLRKNFLFGYGSLISTASRACTASSSEALPVRVAGIRRAWSAVYPRMTAVGIELHPESTCNGVLIAVSDDELARFDERESGYDRVSVDLDRLTFLEGCSFRTDLAASVFMYLPSVATHGRPTAESPIAQSYVDVILSGCFDFSPMFAREFVETTHAWDFPYVNDRATPRYERAMATTPHRHDIDRLLLEWLPKTSWTHALHFER